MATVELVEYQPVWPVQFDLVSDALRDAVGVASASIEHIGSTSVPGLCAKPVLDILLGVRELTEIEARIPALAAIGFQYRPEHEAQIPDRRYFVRAAGELPRVHLHAVQLDGLLWRQHLAFRDALRADPVLRDAYARLKRDLAERHSHDKAAYTDAKGPFIRGVLTTPA